VSLYLVTPGIVIVHEFVWPPLEPVGSPRAYSVLTVVWHWGYWYPHLLAWAGLWRRGGCKVSSRLYHGEEISLVQKRSNWNRCWKRCLLD